MEHVNSRSRSRIGIGMPVPVPATALDVAGAGGEIARVGVVVGGCELVLAMME